MKKILSLLPVIVLAALGVTRAHAAEGESVFIRTKAGLGFYSNVDPVSSGVGGGLDIGFRSASGFGLAGMSAVLSGSAYDISVNTTRDFDAFFFGVSPSYSVTKGIATISCGLGIGVLVRSGRSSIDGANSVVLFDSGSHFALAPNIDLDFDIASGFFANLSFQFIASIGASSPQPHVVSPMAGFGYRF